MKEIDRLRNYALMDANCPCCGQDLECEDDCTFRQDVPEADYERQCAARYALTGRETSDQ